jgi:hypothetical protein
MVDLIVFSVEGLSKLILTWQCTAIHFIGRHLSLLTLITMIATQI